jgi:hypothetical protein
MVWGELSGEDMPAIAWQALEDGQDGRNLRYLAGLSAPARRDILETVEGALRELGARVPLTRHEATLLIVSRIARNILDGRMEPYAGACRISIVCSIRVPELEHWWNLVTDYEVAVEARGLKEARMQIVQAARELVRTRT